MPKATIEFLYEALKVDAIMQALLSGIKNMLLEKNWTVSVAESCTGGLIAHLLTNISGSSDFFKLGIVVYSNAAKIQLTHVGAELLATKGPYCKEVADQLATGVKAILPTEVGISSTGLTGPTGGTPEFPVGTAFIAVSTPHKMVVKKIFARGDRLTIKKMFTTETLKLLAFVLQSNPNDVNKKSIL